MEAKKTKSSLQLVCVRVRARVCVRACVCVCMHTDDHKKLIITFSRSNESSLNLE